MDESALSRRGPEPTTDADRVEALEQQVRQLTSRLAGWVEAQLVQAADDRRNDIAALRSELRVLVDERLATAGIDELGARLDAVAERQRVESTERQRVESTERRRAAPADGAEVAAGGAGVALLPADLAALSAEVDGVGHRVDAFEQRLLAALGRLNDSVEVRLAEAHTSADGGLAEVRDRLEQVAVQASALTEGLAGVTLELAAGAARTDSLEQRVKSAVGRLAESVEARIVALSAVTPADLDAARTAARTELAELSTTLRADIDTAATALRARFGPVQERFDAMERVQRETARRVDESVVTTLAGDTDDRQAELAALRAALEETLDARLREARSEIGTVVADALRRFVVSVDELDERMTAVADHATKARDALADMEVLQEAVRSGGRRIEALEVHTRRTDTRLGEVVSATLAEQAASPGSALAGLQAQLRSALDAHLAETRAEVTLALGDGRTELAAGAAELARRQASLDALIVAAEGVGRDAEERLEVEVRAMLAQVEGAAAELVTTRAGMEAAISDVVRKVGRLQDRVEAQVAVVADRVDALAVSGASEAGALAPVRSDLRRLQEEVAALAAIVAEVAPRRKAPTATAKRLPASVRNAAAGAKPAPTRRRAQ